METIGGLRATGRRLRGPASDLVELDGANGLKHTAIAFHPEVRHHNGINEALAVVRGFLESPWVTGLVELVGHDADEGAFLYPTGQVWSVAEVIRMLADVGHTAGVRAGLELLFSAGQILVEASDTGESQGVYSHGGLTPWRVVFKKDGQVEIIGYALPQVEILLFHEDDGRVPREDSFRYCPPERLAGQPEDVSSDLFALALIAFELMTGKPVYDGLVNDIRQKAARGEATPRLFRFRDQIPQVVRELLSRALQPAREGRFESGDDFLQAVRGVLSSNVAEGPSLMQLMQQLSAQGGRSGAKPESASTMMGSPEEFRKMLEEDDEDDGPARKAWSPPPDRGARRPRRAAEPPASPEPALPEQVEVEVEEEPAEEAPKWSSAPARRSPRRRAAPAPEPAAAPAPAPPVGRVSAVRRSRNDPAPAPPPARELAPPAPAPAPPPAPPAGRVSPVRRRPLRAATPEVPPAPAPAPVSLPAPTLPPAPAPAPAAPPPVPVPDRAAAERVLRTSAADLLKRIRATRPAEMEPPAPPPALPKATPPAPAVPGDAAPAPAPPRAARPARSATPSPKLPPMDPGMTFPEMPSPLAPSGGADVGGEKTMVLKRPAPAAAPAPKPAPAPSPAPSPAPKAAPAPKPAPAPRAGGTAGALGLPGARVPDPIPSTASGKDTAKYTVRRGAGGSAFRMRLPATLTTGEAVCWLAANRVPVRTDLSGALTGWWRLEQDGERLDPDARMGSVAVGLDLVLRFVPNRVVLADVTVPTQPAPTRFLAPVGVAVPVATLLDHLAARHELPAGAWTLSVDGQPVSPWHILDDVLDPAAQGAPRLSVAPTGDGA